MKLSAVTAARCSLACYAFSLFWMKEPLIVGGLPVIPADLLFVVTGGLWIAALLSGEVRLEWTSGYWPLVIYFAALAISALFSVERGTSAFKLATEIYLLSLPVLSCSLIQACDDLRRVLLAFVGGGAIVAALGVGTLLLFPFLGRDSILDWPLHHFGTLPVGPYPRLELTFEYPAMMANYLALALMSVILCAGRGWMSARLSRILIGAMLISALFALTPGFGGLLAMLGIWLWHSRRGTPGGLIALAGGLAAALIEIPVAAVTPILHRTAPFLIDVPGLPFTLAPAVRLLAWIDAGRTFAAHPIAGLGIGVEPVHVPFVSPEGSSGIVTDAHNMLLSIAAQSGILGLTGILFVLLFAVRTMRSGGDTTFGLGLAFVTGLLVQGAVGSFEDARHLWLAYGFMLAAAKLGRLPVRQPIEPTDYRFPELER